MTPTASTLSEIKLDGSREQEPETVGNILVTKQVPKIVKVACRFAQARQRKTVVYMLGAGDPTAGRPDIPMTKRTAEQLVNSLGDHRFDDLDLIVQSSGGDIHAAYLIMSTLRERMNKGRGELIACVPSRAQSAATLLCLGADQILLGELGALGPLDAQIRIGVTDAGTPNYISALHLLKALSRLQEFSLESFSAMRVTWTPTRHRTMTRSSTASNTATQLRVRYLSTSSPARSAIGTRCLRRGKSTGVASSSGETWSWRTSRLIARTTSSPSCTKWYSSTRHTNSSSIAVCLRN